jgi:hypothetical protein
VSRTEYERQSTALSIQFLREKRDGIILTQTGWAEWCWWNGIYPLTDDAAELAEKEGKAL